MNPHIHIRKATRQDALEIVNAAIEIAKTPGLFCSKPSELNHRKFIKTITYLNKNNRGIYLVAESNGSILGHAFLEPLPLEYLSHVCQLTIGVHQGWQEKGIGTSLMSELILWARQSPKIEKIELNVRATNSRALALYKKMGFTEEGRLQKRIKINKSHYIDDIIMALFVK